MAKGLVSVIALHRVHKCSLTCLKLQNLRNHGTTQLISNQGTTSSKDTQQQPKLILSLFTAEIDSFCRWKLPILGKLAKGIGGDRRIAVRRCCRKYEFTLKSDSLKKSINHYSLWKLGSLICCSQRFPCV